MKKYQTFDVTEPKNGSIVMLNKYWLCVDGDRTRAIFYDNVAQCNSHEPIPQRMKAYTEQRTGWNTKVVFIEIAFRPNLH